MIKETIITQLSKDSKDRIKKIVKYHYGFEPKDKDINWIDEMFRNHYLVLHDQRIIRNLVTVKINETLLKYREKMRSIKFEELLFSKSIF